MNTPAARTITAYDPLAEIGWVAREALALTSEHVPADSPRTAAYVARKRALLAHVEATAR